MTSLFEFDNYKKWLRFWVQNLPKRGRGQLAKIAETAQMFPSSLSQTLTRADKHLTPEQAVLIADYVGLSDHERKYFLLLVQRDRAGSVRLRKELELQIKELRQSLSQISARISSDRRLEPDQESVFYSNWYYSAFRVLSSIESLQTSEALAAHLHLSRAQTKSIVDFLLRSGLCMESKNGRIEPGPKHTHLDPRSPLISRHHSNWRLRAMEKHLTLDTETELAYSSPMSLSLEDVRKVREELLRTIEKVRSIIDPSPCEAAYCLNIDWFGF